MSEKAAALAAQLKASVVYPSDPRRAVNLYAETKVQETWDRFRPAPDFAVGIDRSKKQ